MSLPTSLAAGLARTRRADRAPLSNLAHAPQVLAQIGTDQFWEQVFEERTVRERRGGEWLS